MYLSLMVNILHITVSLALYETFLPPRSFRYVVCVAVQDQFDTDPDPTFHLDTAQDPSAGSSKALLYLIAPASVGAGPSHRLRSYCKEFNEFRYLYLIMPGCSVVFAHFYKDSLGSGSGQMIRIRNMKVFVNYVDDTRSY
jgi:hypothetical protein